MLTQGERGEPWGGQNETNFLNPNNVSDNCYPFTAISITQYPPAGTLMTQTTTVTMNLSTPCGGSNTYHVQLDLYNGFDTLIRPNKSCLAPWNGQLAVLHAPIGTRYELTSPGFYMLCTSEAPAWDNDVTENTLIFDGLNTGFYMLSFTDIFGTTIEGEIFIPNNLTIPTFGTNEVTVTQPLWNTNGEITISPVGGFSYSLLNEEGETIPFTDLPIGTYTLNKVDIATRCSVDTIITLGISLGDAQPCPGTPTVTDHEGNVYNTVQIGNQCWMKENLRTTTSPTTGTYLIPASGTDYTFTGKQAFWYNNDSVTYAPMNYGLLYNWNAAVDTFNTAYGETSVNNISSNAVSVTFGGHRRGICPAGWHLPSDAEWNAMERIVSGTDWQTGYETMYNGRGNHAGKLAGGDNWSSSTTSGTPGDYSNVERDISGFSAVPAGYCYPPSFSRAGISAYFWSSSQRENIPLHANIRSLDYGNASVERGGYIKYYGFSVRCLRD